MSQAQPSRVGQEQQPGFRDTTTAWQVECTWACGTQGQGCSHTGGYTEIHGYTHLHKDRHLDTHRHRDTCTHTQTIRHSYTWTDTQVDTDTAGHMATQTHIHGDKWTQMLTLTDRHGLALGLQRAEQLGSLRCLSSHRAFPLFPSHGLQMPWTLSSPGHPLPCRTQSCWGSLTPLNSPV